MSSNDKKLIAVIGATGQQGGGVVSALQASGQFKVRALSRNPGKHSDLAEEVVEADLDQPETLNAAFKGRSDQRRQVPRPALYQQGQGRSDSQGRMVCESYVCGCAFLLPEGAAGQRGIGRR